MQSEKSNPVQEQKERLKKLRKYIDATHIVPPLSEILELDDQTIRYYQAAGNDRFLNDKNIEKLVRHGVRKEWLLEGEEPMFKDGIQSPSKIEESPTQVFELTIDPSKYSQIIINLKRG